MRLPILAVLLVCAAASARAQSFGFERAAGLIHDARSWTASRPKPVLAPRTSSDGDVACFRALDGYSNGLGYLLTLSEDTIILPSKRADAKGLFVLSDGGAWSVPLPRPPVPGVNDYQFELPIRFADSERRASYLYYGYFGDGVDLHPFVVDWRDPQPGEVYTQVTLPAGGRDPGALDALKRAVLERVGTAHEHFAEARPRPDPAEYLTRLDACSASGDAALREIVRLEKAKF